MVDALVGPAGSGKTTTLRALTDFWQRTVGPVVGLAPSATAAHTLSESLGIDCETTAKWLYETTGTGAHDRARTFLQTQRDLEAATDYFTAREGRRAQGAVAAEQQRWTFTAGQLVIVDEASLADTRTLAALTGQAREAGAKMLLVGDHLQRESVDAGGAFAMLARRGPTAELTSLWRFAHPWEARASLELRHAQASALDAYDAHGAFTAGPQDDMLDAALDAVTAARQGGRTAVLQAADNRTVRDLNTRAHADGVLTGTVSHSGVVLHDGLTAGIGDRIVTRHNNRRLATDRGYIRNGDLWDIAALLPDGSIRARPAGAPTGATVRLPAAYVAEHVELGYATSTARSQGITVDETHTIAAPGMAREDLYVAMSRGRLHNHTYVVLDQPDPDCLPSPALPATARGVLEQILATTHAERSATETWETFHTDQPAPVTPTTHEPAPPVIAVPSHPSPPRAPVIGI
ncbi:AAA family ATPase [Cellulomonas sp. ATA003]|uniref:ATP-dependent DNA helicase n=1 Tax=Cellulomonas sp. ATA003 TaxID=3073064 RepID=UPI002873AAFE|nr:AAA family ATPase [Cellulomonas sp. ATA003]WNB85152.1 AAA family ATPase [Cellulomonas sp. ATA003]